MEDTKILTNLSHAKMICLVKPEGAHWTANGAHWTAKVHIGLHRLSRNPPRNTTPTDGAGLGSGRVGTGWAISTAALGGGGWSLYLASCCMEAFDSGPEQD